MKKQSFTIVELIVVMTVLTLMFVMAKNFFNNDNQIYYQGEICINNAYNKVREVTNAALLSRSRTLSGTLTSAGNNIVTPERYGIVFKQPSFLQNATKYYMGNIEVASGAVKQYISRPNSGLNTTASYSGVNVTTNQYDLTSWLVLYRGTGSVEQTWSNNTHQYAIWYMPIWGQNFSTTGTVYRTINDCASKDFFVSYYVSTTQSGVDSLRLSIQTDSFNNNSAKNTSLYLSQWTNLTSVRELYTGAVNFLICNKAAVKCKETHRIFIDTRVKDVFLQRCVQYNIGTNKCTSWQGGNIN